MHCVFTYLSGQPESVQSVGLSSGTNKRVGQVELAVDNFFVEIFLNDFNAQTPKSLESTVFIYFRHDLALFQCPAGQGVKKALQALIG